MKNSLTLTTTETRSASLNPSFLSGRSLFASGVTNGRSTSVTRSPRATSARPLPLPVPRAPTTPPPAQVVEGHEPKDRVESIYHLYLREIGQTPLLTRHEEVCLAQRVQQGDTAARELMIKANLRLVVKIARDYEDFGLPLLDLISEGNIGLMKGVERFDPARGAKLSVYASFWIKQAMRRALANHARTVRLPSHVHDKLIYIGRAANRLQEILGREATSEEIAGEVGMTPAKVQRFRDAGHRCVPLDEPQFDDDRQTLGDTIADTLAVPPDASLDQSTDLNMLREYMSQLDARERLVLNGRYGLDGGEAKTLAVIGAELGVTREWIRQIEIQAIKKLRRSLKARLVVLHKP